MIHGTGLSQGLVRRGHAARRNANVARATIGVGSRAGRVAPLCSVAGVGATIERGASSLCSDQVTARTGVASCHVTAHGIYAISTGAFKMGGTGSTQGLYNEFNEMGVNIPRSHKDRFPHLVRRDRTRSPVTCIGRGTVSIISRAGGSTGLRAAVAGVVTTVGGNAISR